MSYLPLLSFGPSAPVSGSAYPLLRLSALECLISLADVMGLSGRRRRLLKGLPPSASQTGRAVFPHPAFMNGLSRSEAKVLVPQG